MVLSIGPATDYCAYQTFIGINFYYCKVLKLFTSQFYFVLTSTLNEDLQGHRSDYSCEVYVTSALILGSALLLKRAFQSKISVARVSSIKYKSKCNISKRKFMKDSVC